MYIVLALVTQQASSSLGVRYIRNWDGSRGSKLAASPQTLPESGLGVKLMRVSEK